MLCCELLIHNTDGSSRNVLTIRVRRCECPDVVGRGSLMLITNGRVPAGAKELLGWWLVPVTIVVGWMLRYLIDWVALWWIRRYRQAKSA
jgi:hypothetical protein